MSQKKTLHGFFSSARPRQDGRTPQLGSINKHNTENYTPFPLQPISSRLNQMPRRNSSIPTGSAKRKATGTASDVKEPSFKQPKLTTGTAERRQRLLNGLGDGTQQESNLKAVQDRFQWLTEKQKKDANGKRPNDKDFDHTSVHIPPGIWAKLSASQKQYWEVKKKYQDTILFFRVGSFYELYEDDAQVGHDVLGWKLTLTGVGACRQVGCSTNGIDEAVARLTAAGYKVGRMEQLETAAEAKAKRGPKATITRLLTRIHSPATATGAIEADSVTLLALYERSGTDQMDGSGLSQDMSAKFGFAFLDAAAGRYFLGSISDDAGRTNLTAVLTQASPKEVIVGRNMLSTITSRKLASPSVPLTLYPTSPSDFAEDDVESLKSSGTSSKTSDIFGRLQLGPEVMALDSTALIALSALTQHLKRLKADTELVTPAQMVIPYELYEAALRLDGPTLQNLDVLEHEGRAEGSLLSYLDTCGSSGGRRLLRLWLCRPLRNIESINARLDAVDELIQKTQMVSEFRSHLSSVRDLERLLGQVRNAASPPEDGLPDWVRKAAQQRRLNALNAALAGLESGIAALNCLRSPELEEPSSSALLQEMIAAIPEAEVLRLLDQISSQLDVTEVKASKKGSSRQEVQLSVAFLEEVGSQSMQRGDEEGDDAVLRTKIEATTQLISQFNSQTAAWETVEAALSAVDVLCSFAAFAESSDGPTCRPQFLPLGPEGAVTNFQALWHPCAIAGVTTAFVPNDLQLGSREGGARSLLLTGPNMGGKSTLLRATCIATIMGQIGCYTAAKSAVLTPADRIFTRLGAQDRIVAGESTFLVECNEASTILRHATPASLVVLDELGRGTSTFDGYAIAYAVMHFLSQKVDCRLMFATHYHSLTVEFSSSHKVKLGHMAARLPTASQLEDGMPCITFLYKLHPGACPQSYGLQVAQLAGIPERAVDRAVKAGSILEEKLRVPPNAAAQEGNPSETNAAFRHMFKSLKTIQVQT